MLFLELAIIRWSGSNVLYLSYFSNFVLLGSFLGMGIGFLRRARSREPLPVRADRARRARRVHPVLPGRVPQFAARLALLRRASPRRARHERSCSRSSSWRSPRSWRSSARASPVPFARFDSARGVPARSLRELLGHRRHLRDSPSSERRRSSGASSSRVAGVLVLEAAPRRAGFGSLKAWRSSGSLVILGAESFTAGTSWSPYYKIEDQAQDARSCNRRERQRRTAPGDPSDVEVQPDHLQPRVRPPRRHPTRRRARRSAQAAATTLPSRCARGAQRIDAVEIDPAVFTTRQANPSRSTLRRSDRVHRHIDDGRAFLERTHRKYDLIVFALPDSITLVPGQSWCASRASSSPSRRSSRPAPT